MYLLKKKNRYLDAARETAMTQVSRGNYISGGSISWVCTYPYPMLIQINIFYIIYTQFR